MSGEKITATISTLTAVAILGMGALAQPSRRSATVHTVEQTAEQAADRIAALQSDLHYQLELAYRHDRDAFRDRTAELEQTLAAWHASPQSPADHELFGAWLREAISRSLPKRLDPLPPTPTFGAEPAPQVVDAAKPEALRPIPLSKPAETATVTKQAASPAKAPVAAPSVADAVAVKSVPAPSRVEPPVAKQQKEAPAPPATPAPAQHVAVEVVTASAPSPVAEPATKATLIAQTTTPEPVSINLAELNARIGGYHDALDEIDAKIVAAGAEPSLALAMRLVGQVEQLAEQRRFAQLYFDSLTDRERLFVIEPRSIDETVGLVEKLVRNVHPPAADDDFLAAADETDPRDGLLERLHAASK